MQEEETIASMLIERFEETPKWMDQAACAQTDLDPMSKQDADAFIRENCRKCPVIEQCRKHFQDNDSLTGVFYGEEL